MPRSRVDVIELFSDVVVVGGVWPKLPKRTPALVPSPLEPDIQRSVPLVLAALRILPPLKSKSAVEVSTLPARIDAADDAVDPGTRRPR